MDQLKRGFNHGSTTKTREDHSNWCTSQRDAKSIDPYLLHVERPSNYGHLFWLLSRLIEV